MISAKFSHVGSRICPMPQSEGLSISLAHTPRRHESFYAVVFSIRGALFTPVAPREWAPPAQPPVSVPADPFAVTAPFAEQPPVQPLCRQHQSSPSPLPCQHLCPPQPPPPTLRPVAQPRRAPASASVCATEERGQLLLVATARTAPTNGCTQSASR